MHIFKDGVSPAQKYHHVHTRVYVRGGWWTGYEFRSCSFVPVRFPLIPTAISSQLQDIQPAEVLIISTWEYHIVCDHLHHMQLLLSLKQIQIFKGCAGALRLTSAIGLSSELRPLVRMFPANKPWPMTLAPTNEVINGRTQWSKTYFFMDDRQKSLDK